MLHTKRLDILWNSRGGWRFELSKAWGAKLFGFQAGYLYVAVWRKATR
jgi:hypothetical protein